MSSPPELSASPARSIRIIDPNDISNPPRPHRSGSDEHPRLSPTVLRFDPNDPDVRERQRTMDVDSAMQLSRARSASIAIPTRPSAHNFQGQHSYNQVTSPVAMSPVQSPPTPQAPPESLFPMLSQHEEEQMGIARGEPEFPGILSDPSNMLSQAHDPHLLVGGMDTASDTGGLGGLPMYQPNVYRSNFDFSHMETFASEEKARLGITASGSRGPLKFSPRVPIDDLRRRIVSSNLEGSAVANGDAPVAPAEDNAPGPSSTSSPDIDFSRMRQRKLSHSTPHPRRQAGKLALFEGNAGASPHSLAGGLFASAGSFIGSPSQPANGSAPGPQSIGHDRGPYRFSFYSNALSQTIHARSLSELPAEGQTFEELFMGVGGDSSDGTPTHPTHTPGAGTPTTADAGGGAKAARPFGNGRAPDQTKGSPPISRNDDPEANTWWLDVMCPTDEEMTMLSKVFSIHPLTTEDIQMEETREKIELFRNYYLVCFRGFDQDPYSPTHLEPLNMYIIVFREGTLSFHFRSTPHPQNVRRRIKQLKDYISVTSDWISYALIDDITDAFGPLIQSIEYEVDSIDELVLILKETEQSDMLRRIGTCRKKVMGLLRLMGNKADVVKGLAKRCNENWSVAPKSDIGLYLSDIQDHLITMTQNLNHYEKILSRSHSNYLAQISIEMTDANNQINDVLSKLTALGTVLIPMNLITGLWGMNVHVPGEDIREGYTWFLSIIGGLVAFAAIGSFLTYKLMVSR